MNPHDFLQFIREIVEILRTLAIEGPDFLVEEICNCDGAYGARLSGGGFGGAAVAVVAPDAVEAIKAKVKQAYRDQFGLDSEIYVARPWQGVEMIEL